MRVQIVSVPLNGKLFNVVPGDQYSKLIGSQISTAGAFIEDYQGIALFAPQANGVGAPYDRFTFSLVDEHEQASEPCTVELHYIALDDIPTVQDGGLTTIEEDSGAVLISLDANDIEEQVLAIIVTELPTKGKLYITSDGTLDGKFRVSTSRFPHALNTRPSPPKLSLNLYT